MATSGFFSDSDSAGSMSSSSDESDSDSSLLDLDVSKQVYPNRVRIWALCASSGGGASAVLYSRHVTLLPDRPQRTRVSFGFVSFDEDEDVDHEMPQGLSAEGRMWEWMYGGGPPVPGVSMELKRVKEPVKEGYRHLLGEGCVFCEDGELTWTTKNQYECARGHSFAACTSTGLPILVPGISRICGLCQRRCIRADVIAQRLREANGPDVPVPEPARMCEACGGRFIR